MWEQIEALEERVKVQGVHIQQVNLEMDEGGMGDHGDLLMCQKFLQLRRLHELNQPLEQLDKVIEEIMELMLRSTDTASKEKLSRREAKQQRHNRSSNNNKMEWMNNSRG
jgi:hypothetical protein